MMGDLASQCDRKKHLKAHPDAVRTVLDLLLYVESCPKQFLTDSSVQRRKGVADPARHSSVQRAVKSITRLLKPHHKRSDVMAALQTPVERAMQTPPAAQMPEKKPELSFIRPRKYPPSVDNAPK